LPAEVGRSLHLSGSIKYADVGHSKDIVNRVIRPEHPIPKFMPGPGTSEPRNGDANPLPSSSAIALSTESVLDALNLILASAPLTEILKSIVGLIEGHSEGMICSIFLVEKDGIHLRYAAAPNLPESYRIATDGATIGPDGGPCSLASYRRRAVFVADQGTPRTRKVAPSLARCGQVRKRQHFRCRKPSRTPRDSEFTSALSVHRG
jgi:hypothetical protein